MTNALPDSDDIDSQLATLLTELTDVQQELLAVINQKRSMLMTADLPGLAQLQPREEALIGRLQACQQQRSSMLALADAQGLPHQTLTDLASSLPASQRQHWEPQLREASARSRLLQHQSLTNWLLVQRTVLHLSQILEIIATGGRLRPTYGKGATADTSGSLVDQEA